VSLFTRSFVAINGTRSFSAALPEDKSLPGNASVAVLVLNHLKHKFNLNRTGNLRVNVTLTGVRVVIVAMEKQEVLRILSVFL
jgi:hypothetical protein